MRHQLLPNALTTPRFSYHDILKHAIRLVAIHRVEAQGEVDGPAHHAVHLTDKEVGVRIRSEHLQAFGADMDVRIRYQGLIQCSARRSISSSCLPDDQASLLVSLKRVHLHHVWPL